MPIIDKTLLKSYFETGDTPTESQFIDLIDTLSDEEALAIAQAAEAKADMLVLGAPTNVIKGEGTTSPTFLTMPMSGNNLTSVSVVNDGIYTDQLDYKRRITGTAASGSCFWNKGLSWAATKPTKFGFSFWLKDSQIDTVYAGDQDFEFWIFDVGVIIAQVTFKVLNASIGYVKTGTFDTANTMAGDWEVRCIDKQDGHSCFTVNFTNVTTYPAYVSDTSFIFYGIFNSVVGSLNGNNIDYTAFTWVWDENITSSAIHPDGINVEQFPKSIATLDAALQVIDSEVDTIDARVTTLESGGGAGNMVVVKDGSDIYIRTPYNSTEDLVQRVNANNTLNGNFGFTNVRAIPKAANNDIAGLQSGYTLAGTGDDITPINLNGTFIGGNHGDARMRVITSSGHGKTNADVGSEWTDGSGTKFYIMKIVDSNTLWMLSEDTNAGDVFTFVTTVNGNLNHSVGATNTATITVGSYTGGQLNPACKNVNTKYLLDGKDEITINGTYVCDHLLVVDNHEIINPSALIDYLIANVGTTSYEGADSFLDFKISYRFDSFGGCVIQHGIRNKLLVDITYGGFIQAAVMAQGGSGGANLKMYIPRTSPITVGANTYDFEDVADLSTAPTGSIDLTSTYWTDPTSPPERAVEFLADGAVLNHGFGHGYTPDRGIGVPADRLANVDNAWNIWTSRKSYPHGIDNKLGNIAANSWFETTAYRCYFSTESLGNKTAFYYYESGNDLYVFVDYHTQVDFDEALLPEKFTGRNVSVIYKSANLTVHSDTVLPAVLISTTNSNNAYACLKIT